MARPNAIFADALIRRLQAKFAPGGFLHYGQGKWYPGETLPRWTFSLYWRRDGKPIWHNPDLIAHEVAEGATPEQASTLLQNIAETLGLPAENVTPAFEDPAEWIVKEGNLPENVTPENSHLKDPEERNRIARVFARGLTEPSGFVLPVQRWQSRAAPNLGVGKMDAAAWPSVPCAGRQPGRLPPAAGIAALRQARRLPACRTPVTHSTTVARCPISRPNPRRNAVASFTASEATQDRREQVISDLAGSVRTAISVEPRDGRLCVFMPPVEKVEDYLELIAAAEAAAAKLGLPVHIEGYGPPNDPRLNVIRVAPDPGVIEVNIHPVAQLGRNRRSPPRPSTKRRANCALVPTSS